MLEALSRKKGEDINGFRRRVAAAFERQSMIDPMLSFLMKQKLVFRSKDSKDIYVIKSETK